MFRLQTPTPAPAGVGERYYGGTCGRLCSSDSSSRQQHGPNTFRKVSWIFLGEKNDHPHPIQQQNTL